MRVVKSLFAVLLILTTIRTQALAQGGGCSPRWVPGMSTQGPDGPFQAIAVLPSGEIVVGGYFTAIGGGPVCHNIACYDPSTGMWSNFGLGLDGEVLALAALPDGDVLVGGYFSSAGGLPANSIARVNPTTGVWSSIGSGVMPGGGVYCFAVLPDGDVIVGGQFWSAGGEPVNHIARCNPDTGVWSALGTGVEIGAGIPYVFCAATLPSGDVIVGGRFQTAGGMTASSVARYNTSSGVWSALEPVVNAGEFPVIRSVAVMPDGDVIVGGDFIFGGAVNAWRVARYDPAESSWSALGPPMIEYGFVRSLAVLTDGSVLAGGAFSCRTGDGVALNIARYTPTLDSWSPLGSGISGAEGVYAVAVMPDGDGVVGGHFGRAGETVAYGIGRHFFGLGISLEPQSQALCSDSTAEFSVVPSGNGPFAFRWRWRRSSAEEFVDVLEGVNADPVTGQPMFVASNAFSSIVGITVNDGSLEAPTRCEFQAVITTSCGSVTSNPAVLSACTGDYNCDGEVDGDDVIAFFGAWDAGDARADVSRDAAVDGDDVIAFFGGWDSGC